MGSGLALFEPCCKFLARAFDKQPVSRADEFGQTADMMVRHMASHTSMKLKGPDDKVALAKKLGEALKATEADKHSSGKTFGEVIKAGKLPGEK